MRKSLKFTLITAIVIATIFCFTTPVFGAPGGFDEFGYNYKARVFAGPADGVDRILNQMVWGDPTYANDHLVMKWSKAWDDAKFGPDGKAASGDELPWTPEAWVNNEWNGKVQGGSGITEICKIVWVGPELEASPYWRDGGVAIWGQFELIMDNYAGMHDTYTFVHATPAGYGAK